MAIQQQKVGKSQHVKVYRNVSSFVHIGRTLVTPKWVTHECLPADGRGVGLGPKDEFWCEDGRMDLLVNASQHHPVAVIGTPDQVKREVEEFNLQVLGQRPDGTFLPRMRCESNDGKGLIAVSCLGVHNIIKDVTDENAPAIQKGGSRAAAQHVVELEDNLSRERKEKEALAAKLAAYEEKDAAAAHKEANRSKTQGKVA